MKTISEKLNQKEDLVVHIVYEKPTDYPTKFVVRTQTLKRLDNGRLGLFFGEALLADSLEEARRYIPEGLHRIDHIEGEDPVIVESYI